MRCRLFWVIGAMPLSCATANLARVAQADATSVTQAQDFAAICRRDFVRPTHCPPQGLVQQAPRMGTGLSAPGALAALPSEGTTSCVGDDMDTQRCVHMGDAMVEDDL